MKKNYQTYFLYGVQGYEMQLENGKLVNVCSINVIAKTEKEAIINAKKLVKKTNYRINGVTEYIKKESN